MPNYWWRHLPSENLYMEITRREDIGRDLRAPTSARGGVDTSGYALVGAVTGGDVIVHYDSSAESVVGVSRATGERYAEPIWWAARGSYARQANVVPAWLPGVTVALGSYRPLDSPLSLGVIRQRRDQLFDLRDSLQAAHPGQSLYFPWIRYQDSLRTFQTYLAKFPAGVLAVLPEIRSAIDGLAVASTEPVSPQPEIDNLEREVAAAAGRPRPPRKGRGQGFVVDSQIKVEVETHAMNAALDHYSALGRVVDTSRTESYDYAVDIGGVIWHVEVKGTTGDGTQILLTPNEVNHAETYPHVALFILNGIQVDVGGGDGSVSAHGGVPEVFHPWKLQRDQLTPLGYKYMTGG